MQTDPTSDPTPAAARECLLFPILLLTALLRAKQSPTS